jgi:hypothetical protein
MQFTVQQFNRPLYCIAEFNNQLLNAIYAKPCTNKHYKSAGCLDVINLSGKHSNSWSIQVSEFDSNGLMVRLS